MAVDREDRLVGVRHPLTQGADQVAELVRDVVTDRIRDVQGARPGVDHGLEHPAQEIDLRTARILRREFHVVRVAARPFHGVHGLLHDLIRRHLQLHLHVDRGGGDEGVNARRGGPGQGLAGAVDVPVEGAGQAAHGAVLDGRGHRLHGLEVAVAGNREAGLDHVHPEFLQGLGDTDLLLPSHGGARALLAVPERGIEDDEVLFFAHGSLSRCRVARMQGRRGCSCSVLGDGCVICAPAGACAFLLPLRAAARARAGATAAGRGPPGWRMRSKSRGNARSGST